ncbi:unnamed protein product [Effrenium voratum]|nr:unnamed protein product [Effrenium voratum]
MSGGSLQPLPSKLPSAQILSRWEPPVDGKRPPTWFELFVVFLLMSGQGVLPAQRSYFRKRAVRASTLYSAEPTLARPLVELLDHLSSIRNLALALAPPISEGVQVPAEVASAPVSPTRASLSGTAGPSWSAWVGFNH